ncbi:MAG: hypothetical protein QM784_39175 [Polyangiaceae bacterium]
MELVHEREQLNAQGRYDVPVPNEAGARSIAEEATTPELNQLLEHPEAQIRFEALSGLVAREAQLQPHLVVGLLAEDVPVTTFLGGQSKTLPLGDLVAEVLISNLHNPHVKMVLRAILRHPQFQTLRTCSRWNRWIEFAEAEVDAADNLVWSRREAEEERLGITPSDAALEQRNDQLALRSGGELLARVWDDESLVYRMQVTGKCTSLRVGAAEGRTKPWLPGRQPPKWRRWVGGAEPVSQSLLPPGYTGCRMIQRISSGRLSTAQLTHIAPQTALWLDEVLTLRAGGELPLTEETEGVLERFLGYLFDGENRADANQLLNHVDPIVRFFVARRALEQDDPEVVELALPLLRDGETFRVRRDCVRATVTVGTALVDHFLRPGNRYYPVVDALVRAGIVRELETCTRWMTCNGDGDKCAYRTESLSFVSL